MKALVRKDLIFCLDIFITNVLIFWTAKLFLFKYLIDLVLLLTMMMNMKEKKPVILTVVYIDFIPIYVQSILC